MGYNTSELFEHIRLLVQDRPRMSLQEISVRLGIERHTIERVVLKCSRMTFRRYRNGCMAEKATRLLRNSNTSIKEVAITLGYQSPRAFSRAFASSFGVSPSRYRIEQAARSDVEPAPGK